MDWRCHTDAHLPPPEPISTSTHSFVLFSFNINEYQMELQEMPLSFSGQEWERKDTGKIDGQQLDS